MKHIIWNKTH